MTDRASWNMARIASRRALPRELKLHPTSVGERRSYADGRQRATCDGCGYHVCSCKPVSKAVSVGQRHCCGRYTCNCASQVALGATLSSAIASHNALQEQRRAEDARRMRAFSDWNFELTEGI